MTVDDDLDSDGLRSVAFSPDGTVVAVGSEQNRVQLLDAVTGSPIGPPLDARPAAPPCTARPCQPITDIVFTNDGAMIVASRAGAVRWDLDIARWPAAVCARAAAPSAHSDLTVAGC